MIRNSLFTLVVITSLLLAGSAFAKGPFGGGGGFEVYSQDDKGGGWVIHKMAGLGDTLWGCKDVAVVDDCEFVANPHFMPGTTLKFLHISEDSMNAWLLVSAPIFGDYLMACYDPEGSPNCKDVDLELRPPMIPSLERKWPDYDVAEGPAPAAGGGGGLGGMMGGGGGPALTPDQILEPASRSDMWLSASNKVPGPVNLYACRKLATAPECELAIPNWYRVPAARENIGIKKVSVDEERPFEEDGEESAAIIIEDVEEMSAAEKADLRAGDVIVKVDGFRIKNDKHFKGLISQYPATYSFTVELESGEKITVKVRRKPTKEEKEAMEREGDSGGDSGGRGGSSRGRR